MSLSSWMVMVDGVRKKIKEEIKNRDHYDSTRENSPLKKANDAIIIDTTHLNISGQVNEILEIINPFF